MANPIRNRRDREEQHDDQLLTELLRCVKAVETAEVRSRDLRSSTVEERLTTKTTRSIYRSEERP